MGLPLIAAELRPRLEAVLGADGVLPGTAAAYLTDATDTRGLHGDAALVALPRTTDEVAGVMACCYERGVPMVPRGGGTGFAGGAVPQAGAVVIALERLRAIRALDPLQWRMHVEAGLRTADVHRLARENGLWFPPDPGASEQSQIGGNLATNAGGPHAFKYGVCGRWVTGLELVIPPGEVIAVGGATRKDVAGLDLRGLLIGSEGALAIITAAWLRLIPAPEAAFPVLATFPGPEAGCEAIAGVIGSGLQPAVLEYVDDRAMAAAGAALPGGSQTGFLVIAEADGTRAEALRLRDELLDGLHQNALDVAAPVEAHEVEDMWRWRDGVSLAVTGRLGRKVSEDVAVPVDRLLDVVTATAELGNRYGVPACSWGHAGDGNIHASFLFAPDDPVGRDRAEEAAAAVVGRAVALGGTVSGEHGVGTTKLAHLHEHADPRSLELQRRIKAVFDPKGLLNPGKAI